MQKLSSVPLYRLVPLQLERVYVAATIELSNQFQLKPTTLLLFLPALEYRTIINLAQARRYASNRCIRSSLTSALLLSGL